MRYIVFFLIIFWVQGTYAVSYAYITNQGDNSVSVINTNTNKVIQTILNHIDVTIHKKSESNIDLYVRRSFSKHLWDWLKDSSNLI